MKPNIEVNQNRDRFVDTGRRQSLVNSRCASFTVNHYPDFAVFAVQFHQPLYFCRTDNLTRDKKVVETGRGDDFCLAHFGYAAPLCARFDHLVG